MTDIDNENYLTNNEFFAKEERLRFEERKMLDQLSISIINPFLQGLSFGFGYAIGQQLILKSKIKI